NISIIVYPLKDSVRSVSSWQQLRSPLFREPILSEVDPHLIARLEDFLLS
ncbi:hypothetical protein LINPERHAP1_LOCUS8826, partial [Linum perenne]